MEVRQEGQTVRQAVVEAAGLLVALLLATALLSLLGIGCPIRYLTGVSCPGCGMTRAVRALFELDFKSAFEYHPMVFSMPLVFLYILKNGRIIKNKLINNTILILICLGFILNYIIKLIQFYN